MVKEGDYLVQVLIEPELKMNDFIRTFNHHMMINSKIVKSVIDSFNKHSHPGIKDKSKIIKGVSLAGLMNKAVKRRVKSVTDSFFTYEGSSITKLGKKIYHCMVGNPRYGLFQKSLYKPSSSREKKPCFYFIQRSGVKTIEFAAIKRQIIVSSDLDGSKWQFEDIYIGYHHSSIVGSTYPASLQQNYQKVIISKLVDIVNIKPHCNVLVYNDKGFITSDLEFVHRHEARDIAYKAGQITKEMYDASALGGLNSDYLWDYENS